MTTDDRRAVLLGDLAGDGLDLQRAHVVGRGVDHVAGQGAGVRQGPDPGDVGAGGRDQAGRRRAPLPLVAVETIGSHRPGQRQIVGAAGGLS